MNHRNRGIDIHRHGDDEKVETTLDVEFGRECDDYDDR